MTRIDDPAYLRHDQLFRWIHIIVNTTSPVPGRRAAKEATKSVSPEGWPLSGKIDQLAQLGGQSPRIDHVFG